MDPELSEQLRLARGGDVDAFGYVVTAFRADAVRMARSHLADPHLAEDAAQESFVAAFAALPGLEAVEAFPGWLQTVVRTHALRAVRRRRPVLLGDAEPELPAGEDPGQAAARAELRALVRAAVAELPPATRELIESYYLQGRSVAETAARAGLPAGTVKRRLHEARQALGLRLVGALRPTRGPARPSTPTRTPLRLPLR